MSSVDARRRTRQTGARRVRPAKKEKLVREANGGREGCELRLHVRIGKTVIIRCNLVVFFLLSGRDFFRVDKNQIDLVDNFLSD